MAMSKQGAPLNSGCLTAESNPLLNNVVLQTLFEHGTFADLKNWRKVCKLWLEVSLPRWRREVWVKVTDNEEEEDGRLFLGKYMDLLENEEVGLYQFRKHPFRRFKFAGWELRSETLEGDLTRQADFWSTCGTQLSHLEIKDSSFPTFQSFPSIICGSLPNLEALHLLGNRYPFHEEDIYSENVKKETKATIQQLKCYARMTRFRELEVDLSGGSERNCLSLRGWLFLLISVPEMKSFTLANAGSELLQALQVMRPIKRKLDWKLEKLDILQIHSMSLPSFHESDELCDLRFPLTELCVDIGIVTRAESFKQILETYAVTLRKLVVYRESGSGFLDEGDLVQYFPFDVELNNLSELWLVGAAVPQNLNILWFTPNLKRLLLICNIGKSLLAAGSFLCDQSTLENLLNGRTWKESDFYSQNRVVADTDFSKLENLVCSQLEDFIVSGRNQDICNPKHVAALTRLMPNLKRVMLGLGNDGFRVVCDQWKNLEALVVQPYTVDEFGVTGIVPGLNNHSRLPNITDLTNLRYFGMGCDDGTVVAIKVGLSDDSYVNGIAKLPNLRDLRVVCDDDMSGDMIVRVMARFPNGKIDSEEHDVREWHLDELSSGVSSDVSENESNGAASDDDVNENEEQVDEPNTSDAQSD